MGKGAYLVFRRTADGRLLRLARLPAWLPALLGALLVAGTLNLAVNAKDFSRYLSLHSQIGEIRAQKARERFDLMGLRERLAGFRRQVDPVARLNGKLAVLTNLVSPDDATAASRGVGAVVETGLGGERRLARHLSAVARSLIEEVAFQEARQRQLASILRDRALEFAARPSLWPTRGPINSTFGYRYMGRSREFHRGVDIGAPVGTPVRAPADGKVVSVGFERGYGLTVVLEHRNMVTTVYAHLRSADVEEGDAVERGKRIALTGMTGRTTGAHLHYEVRQAGQPMDPLKYMLD
ncbi:M23 family metallopeptidase [Fundidesulfovibrio butyratiphilus]